MQEIAAHALLADEPVNAEFSDVDLESGIEYADDDTFVNPGMPIPANIVELTGITDDMVKDAPDVKTAVQSFLDFCGDSILVAHKANFDMSYIKKAAEDYSLNCKNPYLDTLALSRHLNPELKKHKLDTLQEYFGLESFNHHRACDDAEMLA